MAGESNVFISATRALQSSHAHTGGHGWEEMEDEPTRPRAIIFEQSVCERTREIQVSDFLTTPESIAQISFSRLVCLCNFGILKYFRI